jgi:hypothetical protein
MRRASGLLSLALALLLAAPAVAQEPLVPEETPERAPANAENACEAVARILGQARASGALARVTGTRHFKAIEGANTIIFTVTGRLDESDPPRFITEIDARMLGSDTPGMSFRLSTTYGADGHIAELRADGDMGPEEVVRTSGRREGAELVCESTRTTDGETTTKTERLAVGPATLPLELLVFVVPSLFDQGLKRPITLDGIDLFDLRPWQTFVLELAEAPEKTEGDPVRVITITGDDPGSRHVVRVRAEGARAGEIILVTHNGNDMRPITAEEAEGALRMPPAMMPCKVCGEPRGNGKTCPHCGMDNR